MSEGVDLDGVHRSLSHQSRALMARGMTPEMLLARREKVFELRAVHRLKYSEIAKMLGVSEATILTDAKWILKCKIKNLIEKDKRIVAEQDAVYTALLDKWLPIAIDPDEEASTAMYATDRIARLLVDQAKLHGFHSNVSGGSLTAKEVGQEIGTKVLEAMMKLAQGARTVRAEIIDQPALENVRDQGNELQKEE